MDIKIIGTIKDDHLKGSIKNHALFVIVNDCLKLKQYWIIMRKVFQNRRVLQQLPPIINHRDIVENVALIKISAYLVAIKRIPINFVKQVVFEHKREVLYSPAEEFIVNLDILKTWLRNLNRAMSENVIIKWIEEYQQRTKLHFMQASDLLCFASNAVERDPLLQKFNKNTRDIEKDDSTGVYQIDPSTKALPHPSHLMQEHLNEQNSEKQIKFLLTKKEKRIASQQALLEREGVIRQPEKHVFIKYFSGSLAAILKNAKKPKRRQTPLEKGTMKQNIQSPKFYQEVKKTLTNSNKVLKTARSHSVSPSQREKVASCETVKKFLKRLSDIKKPVLPTEPDSETQRSQSPTPFRTFDAISADSNNVLAKRIFLSFDAVSKKIEPTYEVLNRRINHNIDKFAQVQQRIEDLFEKGRQEPTKIENMNSIIQISPLSHLFGNARVPKKPTSSRGGSYTSSRRPSHTVKSQPKLLWTKSAHSAPVANPAPQQTEESSVNPNLLGIPFQHKGSVEYKIMRTKTLDLTPSKPAPPAVRKSSHENIAIPEKLQPSKLLWTKTLDFTPTQPDPSKGRNESPNVNLLVPNKPVPKSPSPRVKLILSHRRIKSQE